MKKKASKSKTEDKSIFTSAGEVIGSIGHELVAGKDRLVEAAHAVATTFTEEKKKVTKKVRQLTKKATKKVEAKKAVVKKGVKKVATKAPWKTITAAKKSAKKVAKKAAKKVEEGH
jgi:hypothetical protein